MANFLPSIEKLSGRENYNNWAFAMQAYLEHEDLWSCIVDTPETPEQQKRDAKAKSKIIMMVPPEKGRKGEIKDYYDGSYSEFRPH
ncbi:protein of unknown function (DUF4219) [Popillia japonica]|uniref:DUF4219 domain-containing protein n=1 Tax=Popillia japonica TaxID=7064 RepID=A0AAW1JW36_POPJA